MESSGIECSHFDGSGPRSSCSFITTDWSQNLKAATAFDTITTIMMFCLSIASCVTLCCHRSVAPEMHTHVGVPTTAVINRLKETLIMIMSDVDKNLVDDFLNGKCVMSTSTDLRKNYFNFIKPRIREFNTLFPDDGWNKLRELDLDCIISVYNNHEIIEGMDREELNY